MRPAFSSTNQATAFFLLVSFILVAPLAGKRVLSSREQAYVLEGWNFGSYPWIHKQIFEETNDIDILFMGSSHIMWGINTPYVQQKLDNQLGHNAVVRTVGWGGPGFDTLYFIAKDLLEHRHVKMLVFYDESPGRHVNPGASCWFRWGDNAGDLAGIPFRDKCGYYFSAVVGMPHNLLGFFDPVPGSLESTSGPDFFDVHHDASNPRNGLGSVASRIAFRPQLWTNAEMVPYVPQTGATPADVLCYSSRTATNFVFANTPVLDFETGFARKFARLAQDHGCRLVFVHIPILDDKTDPLVTDSCYWPDLLQADVAMVGIPGRRLFAGLSDRQVEDLFCDKNHLNENGQDYFTSLITPALLQLYENQPVK